MDLSDPRLWDNESFTIEQVVQQKGLPQAVRVCEGFCGTDETLNFSCGDYLALDSIKTLKKVSAKYVDLRRREISSRFTIPIGYSGKIKLIYRHKVFKTIDELTKVFPKYAEVKKPMMVNGEDCSFELPVGSKVELEKVFKSKGVMCKYSGKSFLLSLEDNIEWSSVRDTNEYTLKEIVDRWSFPQYVEFLNSDEKVIFWNIDAAVDDIQKYSGLIKLENIVEQNVVVGHHKETCTTLQNTERNHRSIVMLPLDSQDIKEIRVQLSIDDDKQIYNTIAIRRIVDDDINGEGGFGLYTDIQYVQRNRPKTNELTYENADAHAEPFPPPIPPKTYTLSKKELNTESGEKTRMYKRSVSCPDTNRMDNRARDTQDLTSSFVIGEIGHFANKDIRNVECKPTTRKKQQTTPDDDEEEEDTNIKKKKSILRRPKSLKERLSGISFKAFANIFKRSSEDGYEVGEEKTKVTEQQKQMVDTAGIYDSIDGDQKEDYAYEQLRKNDSVENPNGNGIKNYHNDLAHLPTLSTSSLKSSDDIVQSPIASYTTEQLVQALRESRLESFAKYCDKEKLNGKDLLRLTENDLDKEPYNLTKLEIRKFQAFKKRGAPNVGDKLFYITHL